MYFGQYFPVSFNNLEHFPLRWRSDDYRGAAWLRAQAKLTGVGVLGVLALAELIWINCQIGGVFTVGFIFKTVLYAGFSHPICEKIPDLMGGVQWVPPASDAYCAPALD